MANGNNTPRTADDQDQAATTSTGTSQTQSALGAVPGDPKQAAKGARGEKAPRYQKFSSKQTVKARKVTAQEGEVVVTLDGPVQANKGDYVVLNEGDNSNSLSVESKESFEEHYQTKSTKKTPNRRQGEK